MTGSMLALWLTLTLGQPQTAPAGFNHADAIMMAARVQAYYNQTKDYKAKFKQVYRKRYHGAQAPSFGYLWVKKPGLMRWDYASPRKKQLICDGSKIWIYVPGDKQVFWRLVKASQLPSAISFLWGKGNIIADFWVKIVHRSKYAKPGTQVLMLQPKVANLNYKFILFVVKPSRKTAMVVESLIQDYQGNKNHFFFSNPATNTGVQPTWFKFTPPRGVRVIRATKGQQP
jgi:outer membrane lipoprotein carrier protein